MLIDSVSHARRSGALLVWSPTLPNVEFVSKRSTRKARTTVKVRFSVCAVWHPRSVNVRCRSVRFVWPWHVACAYKLGICAMCGRQVLDVSNYKQTSV